MRQSILCITIFLLLSAFADRQEDSMQVMQLAREASAYKKQGELINCITSVKKAIELGESIHMDPGFVTGKLKNYLSNRYSNIGDFDRAIELNLVLNEFYLKTEDYNRYIWSFNNLGVNHFNQGNFEEARNYYQEGYLFANKLNLKSDQIDLLDGLVLSNVKLKEFDIAKKYLRREKELLNESSDEFKDIQTVYYCYTKAQYYKGLGKSNDAVLWYEKSIAKAKELEDRKLVNGAVDLAELYYMLGRYKKATEKLNEVFQFYDIGTNPLIKDPYLLQAYFISAKVLIEQNKPSKALEMVRKAEDQAAFFHAKYMFAESKFFLDDYRRKNLELGVKANYLLWEKTNKVEYVQDALLMADLAKSNVLKERLLSSQRLKVKSVENDDVTLRLQLIYQLNAAEQKGDKIAVVNTRDRLDSLNNKLGLTELESSFSLSDLQQLLKLNQKVLEYFFVDSTCYQFTVTNSSVSAANLGVVRQSDVVDFYSLVSNPRSDVASYSKVGSYLYAKLIKESLGGAGEIVIVPDGVLSLLPFGALPTNAGNGKWASMKFLQQDFTLSYGFSLHSLAQQKMEKQVKPYVGFAPNFNKNDVLSYLKNGKQVVSSGVDIFDGEAYFDSDATTFNMLKHGTNSNVLQLYTHAVSSDSSYNSSYIYFHDRKMYVDEIISLPLQTDLCLLTACEVGLGKTYSGEGITGVAWAFRAAGAHNVVQSIWKLNEQTTSQIVNPLLQRIADGESSASALSAAKQDYINNPELSSRLKHPYYWAGMSHYGLGTSAESDFSLWLGVLVLVISGLALFAIRSFTNR